MSEFTLVRQGVELTDAQRSVMREAMFGMVDGLAETDRKGWRRFWNGILRLAPGEIFSIETWTPRHAGFHKRHMVIETAVFKAQERVASFDQFRAWLKIGAGFVDWLAGPKGGVVPVPRSISYKKADEETMRAFHGDAMAFLRGPHAARFLWPHLKDGKADEMMDAVLAEFDE